MIAYQELIFDDKEAFIAKVKQIAGKLNIDPSWLMVVFFIETYAAKHGKIDSRIQNSIGATGLIQFMPDTARSLGTTPGELRDMSSVEQLDYVLEYLSPYGGRMKSLADVYFAVFFPAAIGKPDDWVLSSLRLSPETIARANRLYDINADQKITVSEVKQRLSEFVPDNLKNQI